MALLVLLTPWAMAKSIHVAVASNFTHTMAELVEEFEKKSSEKIVLSFGSSGKFYAQIKQGAPYQLFFSGDQAKPLALEKDQEIVSGSRFTYAYGRLALWSSQSRFDFKTRARLISGDFNKLALANPKLAPYGLAAQQVLNGLELNKTTQSKWVQGENIAQTFQFVGTGNADLGFVALSQLLNKQVDTNSYWLVPQNMYQPIKQDVVLLKRAENSAGAKALLQFIRSDIAKDIIRSKGYTLPEDYIEVMQQ